MQKKFKIGEFKKEGLMWLATHCIHHIRTPSYKGEGKTCILYVLSKNSKLVTITHCQIISTCIWIGADYITGRHLFCLLHHYALFKKVGEVFTLSIARMQNVVVQYLQSAKFP